MKKRFGVISCMALMLALLTVVSSGCCFTTGGGGASGGDHDMGGILGGNGGGIFQESSKISGNDVFGGIRCNEMLWSYYEADCYEYNGSRDDSLEFREGMKYLTVSNEYGQVEFAALPLSVHFGQYSHFMSSFMYEGDYYDVYTEKGKAMFRKAYMEQYGDLSEAEFQKIQKLFQLDVAEVVMCDSEGVTRTYTLAYEVKGDTLSIYDLAIDEAYNITMSQEPLVQYSFLHDGGKLILDYQGVRRNYLTCGYKETDPSFSVSGYALNGDNQYADLEGMSFYQYGADEPLKAYVYLSNDESPIDPVMELDKTTGNFTISWQQRWVYGNRGLERVDDPKTISGTIVPCTNYGFTDYCGFFLFVDGKCYRYLMSQEEYDERKESAMADAANLTQSQKEDLATQKRNILLELVEAFRKAGIDASVDLTSGKVTLGAKFLFDTNSYALSADGQKYIDAFASVYTSVIMQPEYAGYISKIIVEGHTDTAGSYSLNQTLSQNRADAVVQRCLAGAPQMANLIEAKGCSYDYPVYNDDGSVNMDQSRRVTFSFVLKAQ